MAPSTTSSRNGFTWFKSSANLMWLILFTAGISACNKNNQMSSGSQKKLQVSVGEIKEISLPGRGDGTSELIGTSDNQEVVEVSRQQLAPAVDTLNRNNSGPAVFQIKGVTVGTANVVFAKKPLGGSGSGEVMRTYVVQVKSK
ncbi:hypothetical protein [Spirosoma sp. KNUC1025]|uniref:hypothetical protein n=1 Tax=Spirosoma sp. KNUC1025 TaxID=2894082 RepID=UPI0038658925|nr:hypothetical protein LN737_24870 [Spirosoma sp. KNUC1025]